MERMKRRRSAVSLYALLAILACACDNPVDLVAMLETEVMKANDRYLEVVGISAARMADQILVSPSAKVIVTFDRDVDPAALGSVELLENGSSVALDAAVDGKTLRVSMEPYFNNGKSYRLGLKGLRGLDGSVLLEGVEWDFQTGTAPAGTLTLSNPGSLPGYTNSATVAAALSLNANTAWFILRDTPFAEPYDELTGWTSVTALPSSFAFAPGDGVKTAYLLLRDSSPSPTYSVVISRDIYLDTAVPASNGVSVTYAGSNPAYVKGTQSVSANPSDAVGIQRVEFYIGGTLVATDAASPYACQWDTASGYANGSSYAVYCKAVDFAGNALDSATLNRIVDNAPPSSSASVNYAGFNAAYVNGIRTISATPADAVALAKVDFFIGGSLVGSDATFPYEYSWNTVSGYASGTAYAVVCRAWDMAGNSADSPSLSRVVDNAVPSVSSFTILGSGDGSNGYINTTAATLSLAVADASPLQMRFDNDNAAWPAYEAYAASKGWTLDAGDGTKYVYYQFMDAAGNATVTGIAARDSIVLDTVAPTLAPNLGTVPGALTNDTTPTWSWSAASGSGGNGFFSARIGGGSYGPMTAGTSFTSGALAEGSFVFRVREHDYAGNAGPERTYTVQIDTTPPGSPSISHDAVLVNGQTTSASVTWTWTTGGGGNGTYLYEFNDATPDLQTTGTSASALTDGPQTLYVQERDAAGNWSPASSSLVRLTPIIPYSGASGVPRTTNVYWREVASAASYRLEAYNPITKTWQVLYEGAALEYDSPTNLNANATYQIRVSSYYKNVWTLRYTSTFTTGP